jgi:hypothetical protein
LIPPKPVTGFDSLPPMVLKNIFRFIQSEDGYVSYQAIVLDITLKIL